MVVIAIKYHYVNAIIFSCIFLTPWNHMINFNTKIILVTLRIIYHIHLPWPSIYTLLDTMTTSYTPVLVSFFSSDPDAISYVRIPAQVII